jgi:hypothetical protein
MKQNPGNTIIPINLYRMITLSIYKFTLLFLTLFNLSAQTVFACGSKLKTETETFVCNSRMSQNRAQAIDQASGLIPDLAQMVKLTCIIPTFLFQRVGLIPVG